MSKICSNCGQEKDESKFSWKIKGKRLQSKCKECHKDYARQHYLDNKQSYKDRARKHTPRYIERNRYFVMEYLRTHPCVDCGETDIRVLDFDHLGKKTERLSKLILDGCSLKKIKQEIAKCEVRCANDHRRKTFLENGYWREKFI